MGQYEAKEVTSLINLVDTYKRWTNFNTKNDRSYEHYHPSEWGKCLRMQQYKHYAHLGLIEVAYKELDSKTLRLFDKGHWMHERWVKYFDSIGILRGRWRCKNVLCWLFDDNGKLDTNKIPIETIYEENKSRVYGTNELYGIFKPDKCICGCEEFSYLEMPVVAKELNIKGSADVILDCSTLDIEKFRGVRSTFDPKFLPMNGSKIVGDMKSIGQSAWDFQLMKKGAHKSYLIQLTVYAYILDCEYGVLMYENKNNSTLKWYKVEKNDKWWEVIQWQARTMQDMTSSKQLPPPRPKDKSSYDCKSCEFSSLCHKSKIWKDEKSLEKNRKGFYKCLL